MSNLKAPDNFVPFQKYDRNEVLGLSQKNGHLQSLQEQVKYCWEILEDDLALVALYVHLQYNSGGRYGCEDVFKKNRMNPFLCRCVHFASILFCVLYFHQLILFFHFSCSRVRVWKVIEKVEDISGITANLICLYF